jgi:pyruvate dehydrogenase E1 component alpha subunit
MSSAQKTSAKKRTAKKAASPKPGKEKKVHLLTQMIRIRELEKSAYEMYTKEKIRGFLHLYDGEEAVAVGVIENLNREDGIVSTYREHGHALIAGMSMNSIMAELYGKAEGCSGGRGGSMHLYDKKLNFFGGSAIVANGLPMAIGLAMAYKMQNRDSIACCFFGDGAVDEGEFHESMNLASLWNLPVLFVCENNFYSMGMPFEHAQAETDLVKKAGSYKVKGSTVDGMDLMAVWKASSGAIRYVREQKKPWFLECQTYRFRAHSMFDPERYRKKDEVKEWKKKDPITTFIEQLRKEGVLTDTELNRIRKSVAEEVEAAVEFSENGTDEPVEHLSRFVYSDDSIA